MLVIPPNFSKPPQEEFEGLNPIAGKNLDPGFNNPGGILGGGLKGKNQQNRESCIARQQAKQSDCKANAEVAFGRAFNAFSVGKKSCGVANLLGGIRIDLAVISLDSTVDRDTCLRTLESDKKATMHRCDASYHRARADCIDKYPKS